MKRVLVIAMLLSVCVSGFAFDRTTDSIEKVKAQLRDPASASFKDVRLNAATNAVCGLVNSKNALGALSGYRAFAVRADGSVLFEPSAGGDSIEYARQADLLLKACSQPS